MVLVKHPLEIEHHGLRVEGAAIVEADPVTQVERIDGAVLGNIPRCRQGRFDLQRARGIAHQPVIDIHQDAEIVDGGHGMGVERLRFGHLAHHQNARRRLRRDRGQCGKPKRDGRTTGQHKAPRQVQKSHDISPLLWSFSAVPIVTPHL